MIWTEEALDDLLTTPSPALAEDMRRLDGDLLILGAAGKMGPTLCLLAARAMQAAGQGRRVYAVSRFSDEATERQLTQAGIACIRADLLDAAQVEALPPCKNVIFMAGRKFGTAGQEHLTWAMNAVVPMLVAQKYKASRMVVFSSGNIYPMVPPSSGGADEQTPVSPAGEYAMSCLARERVFEHYARQHGLRCSFFRLNYAIALRYGVLYDMAENILKGEPIPLETASFNCIWQRDANEIAIRSLLHAATPPTIFNVTGPETVSTRKTAERLGTLLGKTPRFSGEEQENALLSNAGKALAAFGYPSVSISTMIDWQAQWLLAGGSSLGKPTHFEQRGGVY